MLYRWKGKKAKEVAMKFCIADARLAQGESENMKERHVEACVLCDWLIDRYDIDINSKEWNKAMKESKYSEWTAGKLINDCLRMASVRLHPRMITENRAFTTWPS